MAEYIVPGGGKIENEGVLIERKVVVSTDGVDPTEPGGNGTLTNVNITEEAAGLRRGVFEYKRALTSGSGQTQGGGYNEYGTRIELMGGTREVPIYNHPSFNELTDEQITAVQTAVENKSNSELTEDNELKLYDFLRRKIEYALIPSTVARISEIESELPDLSIVAKVADPPQITAPEKCFWVCTGVSANPLGDEYEITREYTAIPSYWDDTNFLYGWG